MQALEGYRMHMYRETGIVNLPTSEDATESIIYLDRMAPYQK